MEKKTVTISDGAIVHEYTDKNQDGGWKNRAQFLLTSLGFTIGFGNIWRFSWVAIGNGGGAFLIPYLITTFTLCLTMLRMEFKIGQHVRQGPIKIWSVISPYTCGIGVAQSIICFTVASYYIILMCWCMHYFLNSFQSPLPWLFCYSAMGEMVFPRNATDNNGKIDECQMSGPAAYYWYRETLNISDSLEDSLEIRWKLFSVLIFLWVVVFLVSAQGIKGTTKVIYVTMILPYLAMVVLALRAVFLDGAKDGISYLFKPDWSFLGSPIVWANAATQSLFSIGIGFGTMTMHATMNPIGQNSLTDALFIVICDALTSFMGGIVVFSIMGFRANLEYQKCSQSFNLTSMNSNYNEVVIDSSNCSINYILEKTTGGTGLAFIGFTQTILQVPGASLFSAVFFLMLFSLGFNSFLGFINPLFKVFRSHPYLKKRTPFLTSGIICFSGFLSSIIFATNSGDYFLQIWSALAQDIPIILIGLVQAIAGGYLVNLSRDTSNDTKVTWLMNNFCLVFDKFLNPLAFMLIFVTRILSNQFTNEYSTWNKVKATSEQTQFPDWAFGIAIALAVVAIIPLPIGFFYGIYNKRIKRVAPPKNMEMM